MSAEAIETAESFFTTEKAERAEKHFGSVNSAHSVVKISVLSIDSVISKSEATHRVIIGHTYKR